MGWEAILCLVLVAGVVAGLMRNKAPDGLLVGAVVLCTLFGILTPGEAFAGFANTAMLTVGALYVVAAALRETGALDTIAGFAVGKARSERGALLRLAASVPVMSAFLNNTPIVAMFIPIVAGWSKKHRVAPSRLLIPLSYFCILGGTCTLIGTSTNLVIDGLMRDAAEAAAGVGNALRPMTLFELSWVGVPYAVIGIAYVMLIGRRLLPERMDLLEQFTESPRSYLVNVLVSDECRLAGQTVEEAGLRNLPGLFLMEMTRDGEVLAPVSPHQVLHTGDVLTFTGVVGTIVDLARIPGLVPIGDEGLRTAAASRRHTTLCEAVVSSSAPFVGLTIRDAEFRARYNAAVVAVHRNGARLEGKVGDFVLRPGDTLLLQTGPHFVRARRNDPNFLLVGGLDDARPVRSDKAVIALALLVALVGLMATGVVEIVTAAFLVAGLMVATRCISLSHARQAIDFQTLATIAAAFGLGTALVKSGLVAAVAGLIAASTRDLGPYFALMGIYLMTSVFTEVVTNNAAAALAFPFAVEIGNRLGVDPRPMVMAVAFAASASFVTPLGYQTNLMVLGPGGYRFGDFVRVGLPLNLLLTATATLLIPQVWPF